MYNGIIYKYTSPSGKVYIGQTVNEQSRRNNFLRINESYAGDKIDKARLKYGPENFKYEVILKIETEDQKYLLDILNKSEIYYISKYNSIINGYNILEGGDQTAAVKTEEQIQKQADSLRKYYETHENPNCKHVLQYTKQGNFKQEWDSLSSAAEYYNCDVRNISNCCRGICKTACQYIWRYKEGEDIPQSINPIKYNSTRKSKTKYGIILQLNNLGEVIKEWESPIEAARAIGIKSPSNIIQVCLGKRKSLKGFLWKFKDSSAINLLNSYTE